MINKSIVKITLAVFSLILFSSIGASAQKTDCSKMTDAQIVKAIYDKMKKKSSLEKQILHVNVRSKNGVVTLEGWTTTKKIKAEIVKIAQKIKCVKKPVINELGDAPVGCGPGQKRCGTVCIPVEEECNICLAKTCT